MIKSTAKSISILVLIATLQGCFQDDLERWLNRETYEFKGTYDNQFNDDLLIFEEGVVRAESETQHWSRAYSVDGNQLTIQLRNNSKEKREDIVLVIHGKGEVLTCSVCAMYKLSNVWVKTGNVEAKPSGVENASQ
ncbi:hypothetical protein ACODG7_13325 [Vibrio anguillarum]|uniref:hypothetical protein n=1 Tax=Vibrio anguillarum TaxID=55601 RepID=UPI0002E05647|nr:hypothetical protein [Vibrio anguillarum]OEF92376.1 hypothetical protein A1QY_16520 [Vibrio anguillarum]